MNRIYKVIFNRSKGMYQVVSELVKHGGKTTRSVHIKHTLRLALCIACCLGGMGTFSSYAAGPNENNPALEQRIQEILEQLATQQNLIQAQGKEIKAHSTALGAYDQSLKNFEASVKANKDAINDITKDGGTLDQTIAQVNTMLDATGQGMQRLQESQRTNSGAIAKNAGEIKANKTQIGTNTSAIATNTQALATLNGPDGTIAKIKNDVQTNKDQIGNNAKAIGDITKQGGTLDTAIQNAVQKLTSTGGAVDTNKNAIAKNAGEIQANKTQIGKNTEEIGKNTKAIEDITKPNGTLDQAKQALSNDISSAKNELSGKIDTTKSDLESKITTDIGTAKTELEGKIKKAQEDIGQTNKALEGRVKTNEGNIAANKDQIGKNTKAIEDITKQGGTLDQAKQALSNDISSAKNELSGKIDTTKSALEGKIATDIGAAKSDLEGKIKKAQEEIGK
ncbi:ESPR domain-containing protein, partial [Megasphaera hutchinsoni]